MELHIYGPAFGLPSIDPECIAASTLLSQTLQPREWTLVISSTGTFSHRGLPALRHDGQSFSGFRAIRQRLKDLGNLDKDSVLDAKQQATYTGLTHHLHTRALPLLDTHLYTTSANYISTTRPALTRFLPTAFSWSVPSQRYARAEARTASLGLTASTLSTTTSSQSTPPGADPASQPELNSSSPSLIFARGRAAQVALHKQAQTARFRLEGGVDALCEPLDGLLASHAAGGDVEAQDEEEEVHLLDGREMTSVDYLAYGYLSLLLFVDVPQRGVEELMRKRWGRVVRYVERTRTRLAERGMGDVDAAKVAAQAPTLGSMVGQPEATRTTQALPYALEPAPPPTRHIQTLLSHILSLFIPRTTQHHITALFTYPSPPLLTLLLAASGIGAGAFVTAVQILLLGKDKNLPQSVQVFRAAMGTTGLGLDFAGGGEAGRMLAEGFSLMGGMTR